jgi:hypothetical protein
MVISAFIRKLDDRRTEARRQTLDELSYTEYEGKKILIAVMSEPEAGPAVKAIDELADELSRHPPLTVRVLLDVSQGRVIPEATEGWKYQLPLFDKHVLKAAVVGPAVIRTIVSVVLIASRLAKLKLADRVKAFGSVSEARDFLVKD